jgi:hypothetical protein
MLVHKLNRLFLDTPMKESNLLLTITRSRKSEISNLKKSRIREIGKTILPRTTSDSHSPCWTTKVTWLKLSSNFSRSCRLNSLRTHTRTEVDIQDQTTSRISLRWTRAETDRTTLRCNSSQDPCLRCSNNQWYLRTTCLNNPKCSSRFHNSSRWLLSRNTSSTLRRSSLP